MTTISCDIKYNGSGYILFSQINRDIVFNNLKKDSSESAIGNITLIKELSKLWSELEESQRHKWTTLANDLKKNLQTTYTTKIISGRELFKNNIYDILKTTDEKYNAIINIMWDSLSYTDKESWNRQARINRLEKFNL